MNAEAPGRNQQSPFPPSKTSLGGRGSSSLSRENTASKSSARRLLTRFQYRRSARPRMMPGRCRPWTNPSRSTKLRYMDHHEWITERGTATTWLSSEYVIRPGSRL